MKSQVPQLTPFVRTDAIGAILAEVLGRPDRSLSLAEIGRRTGVAASGVHKEVERLLESGIVLDRRVGRNRVIRANRDHPLFQPMSQIIAATYGPVPVLRELFQDVGGADEVFIFGSWAARRAGEPGEFPRDLDVLVVGDSSRRVLADVASEAGDKLDLEVNVTRLSTQEWGAEDPSPFVQTVRSRPLIEILGRGEGV